VAASLTAFPIIERRALLGSSERQRLPGAYGDLTAQRLTSILLQLQRGEVEHWAELVSHALKDDLLIHLYTTRITRVAQADYQIVPNEFGDQRLAREAATFIEECLGRITNWDQFVRNALHAIALGYSPNEIEWDRDGMSRTTYARAIHYINPNRFRYDDQWKLRLYDHGLRAISSGNMYGEVLYPPNWIVHQHNELAGDPCDAGLMRMSIWRWLFRRWADTFWIQNLEKYGAPFISAEVQPNTPEAVRQQIKAAIVDLGIDRAAVMEAGGKLTVTPPAMGTGTASQHELYMDFAARSLGSTWLGASDVSMPGENGSQAAVSGRISATTDPRMVTDGSNFCGTLHRTLFYWLIHFNRHKFDQLPPIPKMRMKTASDEQKTDVQDLAEQNAQDRASGNGAAATSGAPYEVRGGSASPGLEDALNPAPAPADPNAPPADPNAPPAPADPSAPAEVKKQETALNGAQVTSLVDVLKEVAIGGLPRESAAVLIQVAYNLDATTAEQLLGTIGTAAFTPTPEPAAAPPFGGGPPKQQADAPPPPPGDAPPAAASIPKDQSRTTQVRQTVTTPAQTSLTSSRSTGPLETVLRAKWDGRPR